MKEKRQNSLRGLILLNNINVFKSNIASVILYTLVRAPLTAMGRSTSSTVLDVTRSIMHHIKYGRFHANNGPNSLTDQIDDNYRTMWNSILRVLHRYLRKQGESSISQFECSPNTKALLKKDANCVTDCTSDKNMFQSAIHILYNLSNPYNLYKHLVNCQSITTWKKPEYHNAKHFYPFDLTVNDVNDIFNDGTIKLESPTKCKPFTNATNKVISRTYRKRKYYNSTLKRRFWSLHQPIKIPPNMIPNASIKAFMISTMSGSNKDLESFSSVISHDDNSQLQSGHDLRFKVTNTKKVKNLIPSTNQIQYDMRVKKTVPLETVEEQIRHHFKTLDYKPSVATEIREKFSIPKTTLNNSRDKFFDGNNDSLVYPTPVWRKRDNGLNRRRSSVRSSKRKVSTFGLSGNWSAQRESFRPITTLCTNRRMSSSAHKAIGKRPTFKVRTGSTIANTLNHKQRCMSFNTNTETKILSKPSSFDKTFMMLTPDLGERTLSISKVKSRTAKKENLSDPITNELIKYNDSMLMSSRNEKQFKSLLDSIKNQFRRSDESEKSRLSAIEKQLDQIRNIKKVLRLYSDEENFKNNIHYVPAERTYELNCARSKNIKTSTATKITKIQEEIKKEPLPPPASKTPILSKIPLPVSGPTTKSAATLLINELNSTASKMFQASLKNIHAITSNINNNKKLWNNRLRGGNAARRLKFPPVVQRPAVVIEDPNKMFSKSNTVLFPRKGIQVASGDTNRAALPLTSGGERSQVKRISNTDNALVLPNDSKKIPVPDVRIPNENKKIPVPDVRVKLKERKNNEKIPTSNDQTADSGQADSKYNNTRMENISLKDNTLGIQSQNINKSTNNYYQNIKINREDAKKAASHLHKQPEVLKKEVTATNINKLNIESKDTALPMKSNLLDNFMKPKGTFLVNPNVEYNPYNTEKLDDEPKVMLAQSTSDNVSRKTKQNTFTNVQGLKQTALKVDDHKNEETATEQKIELKPPKKPTKLKLRDIKPPISYTINVNKTANRMVEHSTEFLKKRTINKTSEGPRKEILKKTESLSTAEFDNSGKLDSMGVKKETPSNSKMNLKYDYPRKKTMTKRDSSGDKNENKSSKIEPINKKINSAPAASNIKRGDNVQLSTKFGSTDFSEINSGIKSNSVQQFDASPIKTYTHSSPHFLDLHDIEKTINKSRLSKELSKPGSSKFGLDLNTNEMEIPSFKHKMPLGGAKRSSIDTKIGLGNSLSLAAASLDAGYNPNSGFTTSDAGIRPPSGLTRRAKFNRNHPYGTQFVGNNSSPFGSKLVDIPPAIYAPLIQPKMNKMSTTAKNYRQKQPLYVVKKNRKLTSQFTQKSRHIMTSGGRLRGGDDKVNKLEHILNKANCLSDIENIRNVCKKFEETDMEFICSCIAQSNGVDFENNLNNPRCTARSTKRKNELVFKNPCLDGPFSDILARHFLPGNKGKMPAIVGYKSDGIPIYGPPGAAYNVMGWTRDGSPIFGRGGPGGKEPQANVRAYHKTTPQYEPTDPEEKAKITLVGTYDNQPITGHKDLIYGMVYAGKADNGIAKYKIPPPPPRTGTIQPSFVINTLIDQIPMSRPTSAHRLNNMFIIKTDSKNNVKESRSFDSQGNAVVSSIKEKTSVNLPKKKPVPIFTKEGYCKMKEYPLSYNVGNHRCNKYHAKCVPMKSHKSRHAAICSASTRKQVNQSEPCAALPKMKFRKPGEIHKSVARTIRMHRKRLGLKNPERLLKNVCNKTDE